MREEDRIPGPGCDLARCRTSQCHPIMLALEERHGGIAADPILRIRACGAWQGRGKVLSVPRSPSLAVSGGALGPLGQWKLARDVPLRIEGPH